MTGQIEKMTRMRKNILWGVLLGTLIAFCLELYPTFFTIFSLDRSFSWSWSIRFFYGALVVWYLTILIFLRRFWLFKKKLKKDTSLSSAVYDERVKLNWLIAYRFAFIAAVGLAVLWKGVESFFAGELMKLRFTLPNGPFFILWGSIISLIGSFLYHNREAKNE